MEIKKTNGRATSNATNGDINGKATGFNFNILNILSSVLRLIKSFIVASYWIIVTILLAFFAANIIVGFAGFIKNAHADVKVLSPDGKTYHIAEKNLLGVIKNRIKHVNWQAVIKRSHIKRQVENYQPYNIEVNLPTALHTKVFEPSMWYTLKFNIKSSTGQIIYPKGFRYKITDYIKLPNVLVVINGDNKRQVEWFRDSKYFNNLSVMPLITKGDYYKLDKRFKIPVYYYMKSLQKRFKLKAVPSIIWQKGTVLYVKQYGKDAVLREINAYNKKTKIYNKKTKTKVNKTLQESGLLNPSSR